MTDDKKIRYLEERLELLNQVLEDEVPDSIEDILNIKKQIDAITKEIIALGGKNEKN